MVRKVQVRIHLPIWIRVYNQAVKPIFMYKKFPFDD